MVRGDLRRAATDCPRGQSVQWQWRKQATKEKRPAGSLRRGAFVLRPVGGPTAHSEISLNSNIQKKTGAP